VLKNETVVETPEDVNGVLELCHVLIKDQVDSSVPPGPPMHVQDGRRIGASFYLEREELAEEQGWVARMVHLFRSDNLSTQFEVRTTFSWATLILILLVSSCKWRENTLKLAASECAILSQL
jgi:vacuolar protein sorting-associated protein 35